MEYLDFQKFNNNNKNKNKNNINNYFKYFEIENKSNSKRLELIQDY